MVADMILAQELHYYILTSSNFCRNVHERLSELSVRLSTAGALV